MRSASLLWLSLVLLAPASAAEAELLRLIGQAQQFIVQTPAGPVTITRSKTVCAYPKGELQPLVPLPGVTLVTEIEVLHALNNPSVMVIDMRDEEDPLEATIPNTFHIPYNEIEDRLDKLGCQRRADKSWDCVAASSIIAFCYGPMCLQSPAGIKNLVRMGYPVEKIAYYRGGMMDWEALGLTTVKGNRP